jgi:hypothetical protein
MSPKFTIPSGSTGWGAHATKKGQDPVGWISAPANFKCGGNGISCFGLKI